VKNGHVSIKDQKQGKVQLQNKNNILVHRGKAPPKSRFEHVCDHQAPVEKARIGASGEKGRQRWGRLEAGQKKRVPYATGIRKSDPGDRVQSPTKKATGQKRRS